MIHHETKLGGHYGVSLSGGIVDGVLVQLQDSNRWGAAQARVCLSAGEARDFAARILEAADKLVIKQRADRFTAAYEESKRNRGGIGLF